MTTKILALTDALGNLVRFVLLPGQRYDTIGIGALLEGVSFGALIADKAFDSDAILAELDAREAKAVISQHPRRTKPRIIDAEMYKWRHLIENFFCKLKEFKRIAMRADDGGRARARRGPRGEEERVRPGAHTRPHDGAPRGRSARRGRYRGVPGLRLVPVARLTDVVDGPDATLSAMGLWSDAVG